MQRPGSQRTRSEEIVFADDSSGHFDGRYDGLDEESDSDGPASAGGDESSGYDSPDATDSFHTAYVQHEFVTPLAASKKAKLQKNNPSLRKFLERNDGGRDSAHSRGLLDSSHGSMDDTDHIGSVDPWQNRTSIGEAFVARQTLLDRVVRIACIVLLSACIVASAYVADSCEFLSIHGDETSTNDRLPHPLDDIPGDVTVYVGIFGYAPEDDGFCEPYLAMFQSPTLRGTTHDGSWNIYFILSQWCALTAPVCAAAAWCLLWFSCWVRVVSTKCMDNFRIASVLCFMASVFQAGTFLEYLQRGLCYYNHDRECFMEFFGYVSLYTSVVYGLCGLSLYILLNEHMKDRVDLCVESMLPESHPYRRRQRQRRRRQTQQRLRSSFSSAVSVDSMDSMDSRDYELLRTKIVGSTVFGGCGHNRMSIGGFLRRGSHASSIQSLMSPLSGSVDGDGYGDYGNDNNDNNNNISKKKKTGLLQSKQHSTSEFTGSSHSRTLGFSSIAFGGLDEGSHHELALRNRESVLRNQESALRLQRAAERRKRTSHRIQGSGNVPKADDYRWQTKKAFLDDYYHYDDGDDDNGSCGSIRSEDGAQIASSFHRSVSSGVRSRDPDAFVTAHNREVSVSSRHDAEEFHDEIYDSTDGEDDDDDDDDDVVVVDDSDGLELAMVLEARGREKMRDGRMV